MHQAFLRESEGGGEGNRLPCENRESGRGASHFFRTLYRMQRQAVEVSREEAVAIQCVLSEYLFSCFLRPARSSNNGPQDLDGHERRGSRITLDLLREVFDWVSAGYRDVRVRAQGKDIATTFPRGLFLNFQEDFPFARVMLGDGTKLDVLPAHVTEKQKMYAIRVGKKWAVFNAADGEVVLTEHLKDACLFEMMPANKKRKSARIVAVLDYDSTKYQLRMEGTMFSKSAGVGAQSSEVSMVRYPNDPKIQVS